MSADIARQIADLERLDRPGLGRKWREIFDAPPPSRASREMMLRAIAYRVQEHAFGGLSRFARRRLAKIAAHLERGRDITVARRPQIKPGTMLIRDWNGQRHRVMVLDDGLAYDGRRYRSLSEIARLMTGTRWSGPLFFGRRGSDRNVKLDDVC